MTWGCKGDGNGSVSARLVGRVVLRDPSCSSPATATWGYNRYDSLGLSAAWADIPRALWGVAHAVGSMGKSVGGAAPVRARLL